MTKKILALALAGTTAFSVFAGAMTASAKYTEEYTTYSVTSVTIAATPTFTFGSTDLVVPATTNITDVETPAKYKTLLDKYKAVIDTFDKKLSTATTPSKITNGIVYIADYAHTDDEVDAWKEAVANLKTAYAAAETYYADHRTPGETDTTWQDLTAGSNNDTNGTDARLLFTTATTGLEARLTAVYTAADDVFASGVVENAVDYAAASLTRYNALSALNNLYNSEVKKYDTTSGGDGKTGVSKKDFEAVYDGDTVDDTKLVTLFQHIASAAKNNSTTATSKAIQLVEQYNAVKVFLEEIDSSDKVDDYDHFLEAVKEMASADYTDKAWGDIQRYLVYAEADYAAGKYADAITSLKAALKVEPKAGSITELENTLMSMYADTNGRTRKTYIDEDYLNAAHTVYNAADYHIRADIYTDEWDALFSDKIWYYNPLDAEAANKADGNFGSESYFGIYGYAYKLWDQATDGEKVAQSRIDTANEMLIAALEALDPTVTSPEWEIIKLERTIELAEALAATADSDFNTSSNKYRTFTANLERAQKALDNPAAGNREITSVCDALNAAIQGLSSVAKNPSYNLKKDHDAALKAAKVALKGITDQNAGQYKALTEAISVAENLGTYLDVNGKTPFTKLVSDYDESIAALEAAMNYYDQPQGWYEGEGGWMYGEGDTYVASDWKKVGTKWFYFENGIAVENNWRQIGGKYYYFNQYCVALTNCWGKVDGGWYYFGADSAMKTGWLQIGTTWYYLNPTSGRMMTGWVSVDGKSYYFNADGAMLTSTTTPDGYEVGVDGAWIQK